MGRTLEGKCRVGQHTIPITSLASFESTYAEVFQQAHRGQGAAVPGRKEIRPRSPVMHPLLKADRRLKNNCKKIRVSSCKGIDLLNEILWGQCLVTESRGVATWVLRAGEIGESNDDC